MIPIRSYPTTVKVFKASFGLLSMWVTPWHSKIDAQNRASKH